MIHPGICEEAPFEILNILEAAGADTARTVIAHMDRTVFSDDNVLRLAKRGCFIEYDLFGTECSHSQVKLFMQDIVLIYLLDYTFIQFSASVDFPSDAQKIQKLKLLVDNGFADKILISQDVHTKHRMVRAILYTIHAHCLVPR